MLTRISTLLALAVLGSPQQEPKPHQRAPVADPPRLDMVVDLSCAKTIEDLSTGVCIEADSMPTLGRLYPLGPYFNIDPFGNVGMGTVVPTARLEVAGTVLITDTLTLDPFGGPALDLASGDVHQDGVSFLHARGGMGTVALGPRAMNDITDGMYDTAVGDGALQFLTSGDSNTAVGARALQFTVGTSYNTACGADALRFNTSTWNSAFGASALRANTTGGGNTACGTAALSDNTTGSHNTAVGWGALNRNEGGEFNTATGVGALECNLGGDNNTAFGVHALSQNEFGSNNTASGRWALSRNTDGYSNTVSGSSAMFENETGHDNTAVGFEVLFSNVTGNFNTAIGERAIYSHTFGVSNTAVGMGALEDLTAGNQNTAIGFQANGWTTSGTGNISLGYRAGYNRMSGNGNITIGTVGPGGSESDTIRIGHGTTHTRTFLAGVRGRTTGVANAIPVLVDGNGQLGTVSSSRRVKEGILDMGSATERLLELRPVVFRYKQHVEELGAEAPLEYGLIAEEVAEVFPELVVLDEEGRPLTVKYHQLSSILLNELQGLHARVAALEARMAADGR